jgi:hypothetical protein
MKLSIPIKYGLIITAGLIAWVLITHQVVRNTESVVHTLIGPIFFNLLQFSMIYLGLKAKEREYGDKQDFKKGLKTGVAISLVYAVTAALFFVALVAFVGTSWMPSEPGAIRKPTSVALAQAFIGIFVGGLILGLLYSTVISFFLAKRPTESD